MSSCASAPSPPAPPSPVLFLPCDRPTLSSPAPTWREVAELAAARGAAIDACNDQLEILRTEYSRPN